MSQESLWIQFCIFCSETEKPEGLESLYNSNNLALSLHHTLLAIRQALLILLVIFLTSANSRFTWSRCFLLHFNHSCLLLGFFYSIESRTFCLFKVLFYRTRVHSFLPSPSCQKGAVAWEGLFNISSLLGWWMFLSKVVHAFILLVSFLIHTLNPLAFGFFTLTRTLIEANFAKTKNL